MEVNVQYWKPLSKYRYTEDRNEFKYHTDFSLDEGEMIEVMINGKTLIKEKTPKNKVYKYHFEMAVEEFDMNTSV